MIPFDGLISPIARVQNYYKETYCFLPLNLKEFLAVIFTNHSKVFNTELPPEKAL